MNDAVTVDVIVDELNKKEKNLPDFAKENLFKTIIHLLKNSSNIGFRIWEYITTYPFPPINIETITDAINEKYEMDLTTSDVETIVCNYFITTFEDVFFNTDIDEMRMHITNYLCINLNEPCCTADGDCNNCSSYSLCIQAPEVYKPTINDDDKLNGDNGEC